MYDSQKRDIIAAHLVLAIFPILLLLPEIGAGKLHNITYVAIVLNILVQTLTCIARVDITKRMNESYNELLRLEGKIEAMEAVQEMIEEHKKSCQAQSSV